MVDMDKIVPLCKRRGFIFQSSEIYGGTDRAGTMGRCRELKNNVKRAWWHDSVQKPARHSGAGCVDPHAPTLSKEVASKWI